uniref:Uncharacterized protein n=1 Tax=Rhizophora mucronata TaxID=61149 RepID=A0A2P2M1Z7_RHIMU
MAKRNMKTNQLPRKSPFFGPLEAHWTISNIRGGHSSLSHKSLTFQPRVSTLRPPRWTPKFLNNRVFLGDSAQ